jgi:hypothetical protein
MPESHAARLPSEAAVFLLVPAFERLSSQGLAKMRRRIAARFAEPGEEQFSWLRQAVRRALERRADPRQVLRLYHELLALGRPREGADEA